VRKLVVAILVSVSGVTLALFFGLGDQKDPTTILELAERLRAEGLEFHTAQISGDGLWETAVVEEGLTLRGAGLDVDILRIEDNDTFDAAERARLRFSSFQGGLVFEPRVFAEIYARRPYVIVIREEPERGLVAAILRAVLPPELT